MVWITRRGADFLRSVAACTLVFALAGCGGGSGGGGSSGAAAGPAGVDRGAAALAASTALTMTITAVSINSPPVVDFTVTNETGAGMNGIANADLRFNIAKLSPGVNGEPTTWQNYINIAAIGGAVKGSQEAADLVFGTLVNHGDGTYTYTFATDIRNPAANPCPAPCTSANGKALDLSFQPNTTHRVTIQQGNPAYPVATGIFDFVPGGGVGVRRDIIATAKCNECHEQITGHEGTRVDTRLCVTCHNPGSSVATPGQPNVTVDFKVMIHKIHYNNLGSSVPSVVVGAPLVAALPSVIAGTPYVVGDTDFSSRRPAGVTFTQDARNCTKCHDGTAGASNATAQGDNWKNAPNMDACSSCHDDVYFGVLPDPAKPYQTVPHPGGVMTDNSVCALCHGAGRFTDNKDIVVAHSFPAKLAAANAKFKYNIISATPTTAGSRPVITFSVTDPTNANAPYDIKTAAAFTATTPDPVTGSVASTLTVKLGWSAVGIADIGNDGRPLGQAVSISLLDNAGVVPGATPGTFTVTSNVAIPAAQSTLRVLMEGHPAGDVNGFGTLSDKLRVTSVFKDFAISGPVTARRLVVDIAKCDVCHRVLSWHDNGRNDEPGICVVCHNPNATDLSQRPGGAGVDGKVEEAIDFKTMIHAIHAGQADKGGFRTQGLTVYGSDGPNDFTSVIFPGKLNDCATCHIGTSYQLTAPFWDAPTANGILGTTISTGASAIDAADNLRITPIAAVCSSCHDSAVTKIHIQDAFNAGLFSVTQATINAATPEACSFCHGPGRAFDVQVVHSVK